MNQEIIDISKGDYPSKNKRLSLVNILEKMIVILLSAPKSQTSRFMDFISQNKCTSRVNEAQKLAKELMPMFEHLSKDTSDKLEYLNRGGNPYTILDDLVKKCLDQSKHISVMDYHQQHVLYFFITGIDKEHYVGKPGYSRDLVSRFKSLKQKYNADFYFVGAKLINSDADERAFHTMLKSKYPDKIYEHKISKMKKTELYYLCPEIVEEFDNYVCTINDFIPLAIEQERTKQKQIDLEISKLKLEEERERTRQAEIKLLLHESKTSE